MRCNIFHLVRRGGGRSNGTWFMCATKAKTPERKTFSLALLSARSWGRMWIGGFNPRIFNLCILGGSHRLHISAAFPTPAGKKNCWYLRRVQPKRCNVSQFIYFCKALYMFRTVFPSIIRSSKLHIERQVYVRPILLPAGSWLGWKSWWWTEKPSETCRACYRNK